MKRITRLVTVVAMMVVMVMASTNTAAAQGNPLTVSGVLPVPPENERRNERSAIDDTTACDLGQGGTGGTRGTRAHGLLESEFGVGGTTCFVPLPVQTSGPGEEF
jgi:hypothetical protein